MHGLGRLLQFAGLVILPLAMLMEASGGLGRTGGVSQMVVMMACGVTAFVLGRYLEGYAR